MEITKLDKIIANCIIKNDKGKSCAGHLKEYLTASESLKKQLPAKQGLYRCRRCLALYAMPKQEHLKTGKTPVILPPQTF
jgi:hypothetical protein